MVSVKSFFNNPLWEVIFDGSSTSNNTSGVKVIALKASSIGPPSYETAFKYNPDQFNDEAFWIKIQHKLQTVLFHEAKFEDKVYETKEELISFINSHYPRLLPIDKQNNLLEYLYSLTSYDGEIIDLDIYDIMQKEQLSKKLFFSDDLEVPFYVDVLESLGLIKNEKYAGGNSVLSLTVDGLSKIINIIESKNSRYCFVAMSFSQELMIVFDEAIKPAIIENGFEPVIISNISIDADKTINDAILAGIKKPRFTIADFTQHRGGVYFEAGYALGRGQKVIYTCRESDIEKAHFDTRNFQHVVWNDVNDLRTKLNDKIQAYILE